VPALLPTHHVHHPLGCHRQRIPDRVIFDKLIQILVFGCGYRRIADQTCSATTLRRRRDEWITLGLAERLRLAVLGAYQRLFGLELEHLAVDHQRARLGHREVGPGGSSAQSSSSPPPRPAWRGWWRWPCRGCAAAAGRRAPPWPPRGTAARRGGGRCRAARWACRGRSWSRRSPRGRPWTVLGGGEDLGQRDGAHAPLAAPPGRSRAPRRAGATARA
jgi:hypothetical protein